MKSEGDRSPCRCKARRGRDESAHLVGSLGQRLAADEVAGRVAGRLDALQRLQLSGGDARGGRERRRA